MSERRVPVGRRRLRRLAVLLTVVALAVSACGVPTDSPPIVDPNLPTRADQAGSGGAPALSKPDNFIGESPAHFIEQGYLTALAAQVGPSQQLKAVQQFLAPNANWAPPPPPAGSDKTMPLPVTVVRVVDDSRTPISDQFGRTNVTIDVQVVGSFDPASGTLTSQTPSSKVVSLSFDLTTVGVGPVYQVASAPIGYYITADALANPHNYVPQMIYYWTASGQLVPDLRYLANWLSPQQQASSVVDWILDGAPAWMGNQIKPAVPAGIRRLDQTITVDDGAFVINLNPTTLLSEQRINFLIQVSWSLGPIHADWRKYGSSLPQPIELQIANNTVVPPSSDYLRRNQSTIRDSSPIAYAIVDGKAQAIGYVPSTTNPQVRLFDPDTFSPTKAAFASPENQDVVLGALHVTSPLEADVALVRLIGGRQQLWVTRPDSLDGGVKYVRVKLPASFPKAVTFGRPVWLNQSPGAFAIVADGKLYVVTPKNTFIAVATNAADISSLSVAQDGYRVAYVSGGQVWTALLSATGEPMMTQPTPVNLGPNLEKADSVAWSSIDNLVVAGTKSGGSYTIEVNCDGNNIVPLSAYPGPLTQIVSYPALPQTTLAFGPVMVQTSTGAFGGRARLVPLWTGKGPVPNDPFFGE